MNGGVTLKASWRVSIGHGAFKDYMIGKPGKSGSHISKGTNKTGIIRDSDDATQSRKTSGRELIKCPYPKPTQVGEASSLRCSREPYVKELGKIAP